MVDAGWEEKIYPAAKLALIVDGLIAEGVSPAAVLRRVGIPLNMLRSPETRVSINQVVDAYLCAMKLSSNPFFAYHTGLRSHVSLYGMYGFAILSSMDFRQTMHFAVKYHGLATPLVRLRFEAGTRRACWAIDPLPHPAVDPCLFRFIVEMQIGVTVSFHRDVMGSTFRPLEVHTSFSVPHEDLESYSKLFGCSVISNQEENRVVFDASWLDGTPQFGNEITYASVVSLCDDLHEELVFRVGIMGKVRELLLATIGRNTSFEKVAHELDMPVRTLSRKLAGQGTSFRDLKDRLRAHAATKYLRDTEMTTEDIAHVLGFSDTASFRRAFRRWTRTSPKNFRRGLSMTS